MICDKVLRDSKVTKLYAFDTVSNTVGSLFDAILFVEEFGRLPAVAKYSHIYSVRIKDDLSLREEMDESLKKDQVVTMRDIPILRAYKPKRQQFQRGSIGSSLINFTTEYCDGKKRSKMLRKVAIKMFKDILKVMGISKDSKCDIVSKVRSILVLCQKEKLLRDELVFQLIKQTTNNPNTLWNIRAWSLLYLAAKHLNPRKDTAKLLQCHSAMYADPVYSDECNSVQQYAHRVFEASSRMLWQMQHDKIKALRKPTKSEIYRVLSPDPTVIIVQISKYFKYKTTSIKVQCGGGRKGGMSLNFEQVCATVLRMLKIKGNPKELGITLDLQIDGSEEVQRQSM